MEISKVWNYDILLGYQTAIDDLLKNIEEKIEKEYPESDDAVWLLHAPHDYIVLSNIETDLLNTKYQINEQMDKVINDMAKF